MRCLELKKGSALLATDRFLRRYLSGIDVAEGYLIAGNRYVYLTDARYYYGVKDRISGAGILPLLYSGENSIKEALNILEVKTLYIDYDKTTVRDYETFKGFGVSVEDGSGIIGECCAVKTDEELSSIVRACEIAEKSYADILPFIKEGVTETEIKDRLESAMKGNGAEDVSFDTIVAFGENSAVPHHETGETVLKKDNAVLIDFGCKVNGFCSDCTRTSFYGTPSQRFIDNYNSVLKSNEIAEEKILSGMNVKEADAIARDYLSGKGIGDKFTHSLGHGVGLEIHEYPRVSPKGSGTLKEGMVFTVEPGVYFDGEYGIRIEDTVVIKGGKVKRLFTDDKGLKIIK